jgi:MFS superfamily sulfate permease-like transporter
MERVLPEEIRQQLPPWKQKILMVTLAVLIIGLFLCAVGLFRLSWVKSLGVPW